MATMDEDYDGIPDHKPLPSPTAVAADDTCHTCAVAMSAVILDVQQTVLFVEQGHKIRRTQYNTLVSSVNRLRHAISED